MLNQLYGLTYYVLIYDSEIDDDEWDAINWYLDDLQDLLETEIDEKIEQLKKISRLARQTSSIVQEISRLIEISPQNYP